MVAPFVDIELSSPTRPKEETIEKLANPKKKSNRKSKVTSINAQFTKIPAASLEYFEKERKAPCCGARNLKACIIFLVICFSPIILAIAMLISNKLQPEMGYVQKYPDGLIYDPRGRKIVRTVFFGDSLIQFSDNDFGLITRTFDMLSKKWPKFAFDGTNAGIGGNTVERLLMRVDKDVIAHNPDCIILYFESDATDLDDAGELAVQNRYLANMRTLLSTLTRQAPMCVGLAGPTIFGEHPRNSGKNPRDGLMDAYVHLNERVSAEFNVTYFHTRNAFFSALPLYWDFASGYLTVDGEHHNANGVKIVGDIFLEYLIERYTVLLGPPTY